MRIDKRRELGFSDDDKVLCYLGDITSGAWHRVDIYVKVCLAVSKLGEDYRLLFLIPEVGAKLLTKALDMAGVKDKVKIVSPPYDEVPIYLSAADYGMMFLHRRKNAVGTKIGEYLAAGLPVLINENCLGAVELVRQHDIGRVVKVGVGDLDPDLGLDFAAQLETQEGLEAWSKRVSEFALNYFDNRVIAERYYDQYQCLQ